MEAKQHLPEMRRSRSAGFIAILLMTIVFSGVPTFSQTTLEHQGPLGSMGLQSRIWTVEDDLPHDRVLAIIQAQSGHLLLATVAGVTRFDGRHFEQVESNKLPNEVGTASALLEDSLGRLWIGTDVHGAVCFDGSSRRVWTTADGLPGNNIRALAEDQQGGIWVGTLNGLVRIYEGRVRNYSNEVPHPRINVIRPTDDGSVWIGTEHGLMRWDGSEFELFTADDGLNGTMVNAIEPDSDGLWIATWGGGLCLKDDSGFQPFGPEHGMTSTQLTALALDRDNTLWVGSADAGVFRWAEDRFVAITSKQGLASDIIISLFADREGNVWLGTQAGLNRLRHSRFSSMTRSDGLQSNLTYVITEDQRGRIWIGSDRGLDRLDGNRLENLQFSQEPLGQIRSLSVANDGSVWIAEYGKRLLRVQGERVKSWTETSGLPEAMINVMCEEPNGYLLGTIAGLFRLQHDRFERIQAIPKVNVFALLRDSRGRLFVATYGAGLFVSSGDRWRSYDTDNGLPSDEVYSFLEGPEHEVWIGTANGLVRFADDTITSFSANAGFPEIPIVGLLLRDDELWMTTAIGLLQTSLDELERYRRSPGTRVALRQYGRDDGLPSSQCSGPTKPGLLHSSDGRLWFATQRGLTILDRARPFRPAPPPVAVVDGLIVDGEELALDRRERIVILPGRTRVAFRFSAVSLSTPSKLRFRYQLIGQDDGWIDSGTEGAADYTNLAPGRYRFEVDVTTGNRVWSPEPASVELDVLAHFWQRRAIQLGVVLVLLSVVFGGHRLRLRQLKSRAAELERTVADRTEALSEANRQLATAARTDPLTSLPNRRALIERADAEIQRFRRRRGQYSIVLGDVDHFKKFNDQYGHACGDAVLKRVAKLLRQSVRGQDFIARWGGEEFILLLPDTDASGAAILAENLRTKLEDATFAHGELSLNVTMTFGIASATGDGDLDDTVARADHALYEGKLAGRNRVVIWSGSDEVE
jgi:diguanylate cyclase (GGDEF)-like protein